MRILQPGEEATMSDEIRQELGAGTAEGEGVIPRGQGEDLPVFSEVPDTAFWMDLDRRRSLYYILLFSWIGLRIVAAFDTPVSSIAALASVPVAILFLSHFLTTAQRVGYSTAHRIGIFLLMLIPLVGLVTLAIVDRRIGDAIANRRFRGTP